MRKTMLAHDPRGSRLQVRVVTRSRIPGVDGRHRDARRVRVASVPEEGKANRELVELLEQAFGCPVELVRGHRSRAKEVLLVGLTPNEAQCNLPS